MPTGEHESPIALAKLDPGIVAWLLSNVFHIKVPDYHHARTHATDVRVVVPRTYHADGMLLFCDPAGRPLLAVVLEVQRRYDRGKQRTWKLYLAQFEKELDVDAALVVFCPRTAVARRYRTLFTDHGLSLPLRPMIFTPGDVPLVTDVELARNNPALAVLSAICHGGQAALDDMFPALAQALLEVGAPCWKSAPTTGSCIMAWCWPGCPHRPGFVGRRTCQRPRTRSSAKSCAPSRPSTKISARPVAWPSARPRARPRASAPRY